MINNIITATNTITGITTPAMMPSTATKSKRG